MPKTNVQGLADYAKAYDLPWIESMTAAFETYRTVLLEWNQVMNLTAITDPAEILIKHFLDSLLVQKAWDMPAGGSLIDVGTGAGFPGVPLKIARPDVQLTLLDSLQKRTRFLAELSQQLGQEDNQIVHARAEDAARSPTYREQYDVATARAVAALPVLCEYCLPFVKIGGVFLAMKGPDPEEEMTQAQGAVAKLGAEIVGSKQLDLPTGDRRSVVIIKKISQIPPQYPRKAAKIAQAPLQ